MFSFILILVISVKKLKKLSDFFAKVLEVKKKLNTFATRNRNPKK